MESGAVKRLRGFSSPEVLLRTLLLHVGLGYSLRETVVRARFANWADVAMWLYSNACGTASNGCVSCA
jgi:Tfp pilus assembly protein PilV